MDNILKGAIDLHIHCSPDIVSRSVDDLDLAKEAAENEMGGFVIKNHYAPTAGRTALVWKVYPTLNAVGSITLDSAVDGINPMAVETLARMGGKVVWFPTFDSYLQLDYAMKHTPQFIYMQMKLTKAGMPHPAIRVLDDKSEVRKEVRLVLVCKINKAVLFHQNGNRSKVNESKKGIVPLVIPGCYSAKPL